jgi:hypothetical protein
MLKEHFPLDLISMKFKEMLAEGIWERLSLNETAII